LTARQQTKTENIMAKKLSPKMQTELNNTVVHGPLYVPYEHYDNRTFEALEHRGLVEPVTSDSTMFRKYAATPAGRTAATVPAQPAAAPEPTYAVTAGQLALLIELNADYQRAVNSNNDTFPNGWWDGLLDLASPENKRDLRALDAPGLTERRSGSESAVRISREGYKALADGRVIVGEPEPSAEPTSGNPRFEIRMNLPIHRQTGEIVASLDTPERVQEFLSAYERNPANYLVLDTDYGDEFWGPEWLHENYSGDYADPYATDDDAEAANAFYEETGGNEREWPGHEAQPVANLDADGETLVSSETATWRVIDRVTFTYQDFTDPRACAEYLRANLSTIINRSVSYSEDAYRAEASKWLDVYRQLAPYLNHTPTEPASADPADRLAPELRTEDVPDYERTQVAEATRLIAAIDALWGVIGPRDQVALGAQYSNLMLIDTRYIWRAERELRAADAGRAGRKTVEA